jgi:hypothetical protein
MRKTALKRGGPIARKTRIRPVNAKRRKKTFARTYESSERVLFVKQMCCIVGRIQDYPKCWGDIENAHSRGGGAGRKADAALCVPLCHHHHLQLHAMGPRLFQLGYGVNLEEAAKAVEMAWQLANGARPLEQRRAGDSA